MVPTKLLVTKENPMGLMYEVPSGVGIFHPKLIENTLKHPKSVRYHQNKKVMYNLHQPVCSLLLGGPFQT